MKQIFKDIEIEKAYVSKVKTSKLTESGTYIEIEESNFGDLIIGSLGKEFYNGKKLVFIKGKNKETGKKVEFKFFDYKKFEWIQRLIDLEKYDVTKEMKRHIKKLNKVGE